VSFPISSRVLVTLRGSSSLDGTPRFDSDSADGIDSAFLVESYPDEYTKDRPELVIRSIYMEGQTETVDLDELSSCRGAGS